MKHAPPGARSSKKEIRRRCGVMHLTDTLNHPGHSCFTCLKEPISFPVFPHPAMPSCPHSGNFLSSHF